MLNRRLLSTGSFIAGLLVGALAFAAAGHRVWAPAAAPTPQPVSGTEMADPSAEVSGLLPEASTTVTAAMPAVSDRSDRWEAVDRALIALSQRVTALETRLTEAAAANPVAAESDTVVAEARGTDQDTLVAAGVDPGQATEILRRQSQLEMRRLELRDQASREAWLDSERFFEELRNLEGDAGDLRQEVGDDAYDRFLYLSGQPNRVVIASVIDQSPAQLAGIEVGDRVLDYADSRIFAWSDLRTATRDGERGEYVRMRVKRQEETLELLVPRGPLGVRLGSAQVDPKTDR